MKSDYRGVLNNHASSLYLGYIRRPGESRRWRTDRGHARTLEPGLITALTVSLASASTRCLELLPSPGPDTR